MRIHLTNDTRGFHAGSTAAVEGIIHTLEKDGHKIVAATKVGLAPIILEHADAVVCNGEGTLHHGQGTYLLDHLVKAKEAGKQTYLINTVWESMSVFDVKKALTVNNLVFRDVSSTNNFIETAERGGITVNAGDNMVHMGYCMDTCVLSSVTEGGKAFKDCKGKVVIGQFYAFQGFPINWFTPLDFIKEMPELAMCEFETLNLKEGKWNDLIETLKGARVYITGQHHGAYLACLAGVPFVCLEGTSHKMMGLINTVSKLGKLSDLFAKESFMPIAPHPAALGQAARKYMVPSSATIVPSINSDLFKIFHKHFGYMPHWPGLIKKIRASGDAEILKA